VELRPIPLNDEFKKCYITKVRALFYVFFYVIYVLYIGVVIIDIVMMCYMNTIFFFK
jgi:hypothetical protein